MENTLPKGWVNLKIGDLCIVERGGSPRPISKFLTDEKDGINWIKISDGSNSNKYILATKERIKKEGKSKSRYVQPGDLLLSNSMSFGRPYILKTDGCIHDGWLVLKKRISNSYDNEFLYYLLSSDFLYSQFNDLASGSTVRNLNKELVSSCTLTFPPLPEQERIVAKLDKLFAQHEKIKKALDRIPQLLKAFRQQVLTQAVTGKLTEQWREGKELDEWKEEFVKNITTKLGSGSTPRGGSATYLSEGIPLVRSMNVVFGGIKLDGLAFINEAQAFALKNVEIQYEDILLNITGASIGRLCLADQTVTGGRVNQHVFIIRANREIVCPKFLECYLRSNLVQSFIEEIKYGAGMEAISKTQIENLKINIPTLLEQQEIVRRVESLFAKADYIEGRYQTLKAKIGSLPQAILHKAFKGELVPQLPNDGDAKDLLAEIMALKKGVNGKKK